ncbi:hypothetical protein [Nonomuraea fuscirosea]|uniref:hypothetical protein n=1 Tax=Nonomuraea fuscirosea TaxID=1291556 RepID=UPI003439BD4E
MLWATDVEGVDSIYSLTFAALLIPLSRMGDARGRRRAIAFAVWGSVIGGMAALLLPDTGGRRHEEE